MDEQPTEGEARTNIIQTHDIRLQIPSASGELSQDTSYEIDFMARCHVPVRLPQLDGPPSVNTKRKHFFPTF